MRLGCFFLISPSLFLIDLKSLPQVDCFCCLQFTQGNLREQPKMMDISAMSSFIHLSFFFAFVIIQEKRHWRRPWSSTLFNRLFRAGKSQVQLRDTQWRIMENIMFRKSIFLRWQLDARIDTTRATCSEIMPQGQGAPTVSFDNAVL